MYLEKATIPRPNRVVSAAVLLEFWCCCNIGSERLKVDVGAHRPLDWDAAALRLDWVPERASRPGSRRRGGNCIFNLSHNINTMADQAKIQYVVADADYIVQD